MSFTGYRAYSLDLSLDGMVLQGVRIDWPTAEMTATCSRSNLSLKDCHEAEYERHTPGQHEKEAIQQYLDAHPDSGLNFEHFLEPLCGIYSYKTLVHLRSGFYRPNVIARVENFGDLVVETEHGYRSAKTRITELFYLPPEDAEAEMTLVVTRYLNRKYGVPVSATSFDRLMHETGEYTAWVGIQQVEATHYMLNANHGSLTYFKGASSWPTLASLSASTPTSQSPFAPIPQLNMTLTQWSQISPPSYSHLEPPKNPSLLNRYLDWTFEFPAPIGFTLFAAPFIGVATAVVTAVFLIGAVLS